MLCSVNNAHRTEMQLNRRLVMNNGNLTTYVWNGEYIHVCMCVCMGKCYYYIRLAGVIKKKVLKPLHAFPNLKMVCSAHK